MAAAQAINSPFESGFQSIIEIFARRVDELSGNRLSDFLKESTGLTQQPSFLSKSSFGVTKALQSTRKPPTLSDMLLETVGYTIEEARERLSTLVGGAFIPDTIHDLYEYLKEHSFDLETRINKITGEVVNFLVDKTTLQAIPAAQVDPSLSRDNVLKLELRSRLKAQIGEDSPSNAFGSWAGMSWTRDSMQSKFGYTVENNQGYFGRVVGVVSDDPSETAKLLEECRRRNIDVIIPRTHDGSGEPVVGLPILARNKSMKAELVDRGLDHKTLSEKFGGGLIDQYTKMAQRAKSPTSSALRAEEVSIERFNEMFLNQSNDIDMTSETGFGFDVASENSDPIVKITRSGQHIIWDRTSNSEIPTSVANLPYGEYERFDADNNLVGFTTVDDESNVVHYDRLHNAVNNEIPRVQEENTPASKMSYGFH